MVLFLVFLKRKKNSLNKRLKSFYFNYPTLYITRTDLENNKMKNKCTTVQSYFYAGVTVSTAILSYNPYTQRKKSIHN